MTQSDTVFSNEVDNDQRAANVGSEPISPRSTGHGFKSDSESSSPRHGVGKKPKRRRSSWFRIWAMTQRLSQRSSVRSLEGIGGPRGEWSAARRKIAHIVEIERFDTMMAIVIAINLGVMIYETNANAAEDCENSRCAGLTVEIINIGLLAIYTAELCARCFVYRLMILCDIWMLVDVLVVMQGIMDLILVQFGTAMPNGLELLKLFRIFRILRAVRIIRRIPELHTMVRGFFSAMAAMAWGFAMIVLLLVMWSILAVEFINEKNQNIDHGENKWCYEAFSSVQASSLFFFQTLVAGDSWGTCAIPIIMYDNTTAVIFALALVCVQLGFTNLILSVIVDTATKERERDRQEEAEAKRKAEKSDTQAFLEVLKRIDKDNSGQICLEELVEGYETEPRVRELLKHLNMEKKDLLTLFSLMDVDDSGEVSYTEFIEYFMEAETQDLRVQLMVLKLQMKSMSRRMYKQVDQVYRSVADVEADASAAGGTSSGGNEAAGARRRSIRASRKSIGPRSTPDTANLQQQVVKSVEQVSDRPTSKTHEGPVSIEFASSTDLARFQQYWDQRTLTLVEDSQRRAEQMEARMDQHVQNLRDLLIDAPPNPFARQLPRGLRDGAAGTGSSSVPHRTTALLKSPRPLQSTDSPLDPGWIPAATDRSDDSNPRAQCCSPQLPDVACREHSDNSSALARAFGITPLHSRRENT